MGCSKLLSWTLHGSSKLLWKTFAVQRSRQTMELVWLVQLGSWQARGCVFDHQLCQVPKKKRIPDSAWQLGEMGLLCKSNYSNGVAVFTIPVQMVKASWRGKELPRAFMWDSTCWYMVKSHSATDSFSSCHPIRGNLSSSFTCSHEGAVCIG